MPQIDLKSVIETLKDFSLQEKKSLQIILLGGLALHHYGMGNRSTIDIDAEVVGDLESLFKFRKTRNIPSDLTVISYHEIAYPRRFTLR